jgi:preprotein translocase subunit YajC
LVLAIAQAIFLFINLITITPYLIITILSYILYFYHRKKQEKYMKIVDEVLEELTSREV